MRKSDVFLIESDRSGNRLSLNGQSIARFATLDAAEAQANKVANRAVPGASLRFELDFKWTLTDLEIRAATLERASTTMTVLNGGRDLADSALGMRMNEKLQDVLKLRRKAVKRFCRMAELEQDLVEEWLSHTTDVERYSAWRRHELWLVAALNDWRQATDALLSALEKRQ
jgi:hypothetical protein